MEASVRADEGRGGGNRRVETEKRGEVGLERWIGGRIGGIGLICGEGCGSEEMLGRFCEIAAWRMKFSAAA